jgi:hypothetical protein
MTKVAQQLKSKGINKIILKGGAEEVRDICRLTCLEQGIVIEEDSVEAVLVTINHLKIFIHSELEEEQSA